MALWPFRNRNRRDIQQTVTAQALSPGLRLYAIGDVHGRADLLETLLRRIERDAEEAKASQVQLVFLGDYIDRGPGSRAVLERLSSPFAFADAATFLMGNHEEALLRFLDDPAFGPDWRRFGAMETLASYGIDVGRARRGGDFDLIRDALRDRLGAHLAFVQSLSDSARVGGYFFCHAGVRPGVPLNAQSEHDLRWIREEFLTSDADFGAVVVHGHTPCERVEIKRNRINVDTGAYATDRLSCVVLHGACVDVLDTQAV